VKAMTLDEWIDELKYGDLDSIKDGLDAIELIEFLEELKKRRESKQCAYDKLQAEMFDYSKCSRGFLISNYEAGYDDGIKRAMAMIESERGSDGRE
jgi:aryl carrier-like protein